MTQSIKPFGKKKTLVLGLVIKIEVLWTITDLNLPYPSLYYVLNKESTEKMAIVRLTNIFSTDSVIFPTTNTNKR